VNVPGEDAADFAHVTQRLTKRERGGRHRTEHFVPQRVPRPRLRHRSARDL
jgi:hypothetical protein